MKNKVFIIDDQTKKDLMLFSDLPENRSVFKFFDKTTTTGGKDILLSMFNNPLTHIPGLKERTDTIRCLHNTGISVFFSSKKIEFIEYYLAKEFAVIDNWFLRFIASVRNAYAVNQTTYTIHRGIQYIAEVLRELEKVLTIDLENNKITATIKSYFERINHLKKNFSSAGINKINARININEVYKLHSLISSNLRDDLKSLLQLVYELDALFSICLIAKNNDLCYPQVSDSEEQPFILEDFYHPLVHNCVKNSIRADVATNVMMVTGPNMSGKSTLMKSVGLSVYLAHCGLPVFASSFICPFFNGLVTSLNLSDDLLAGKSYFFNEVKRIKDTVVKLVNGYRLFMAYDELFKGTNLVDSQEASFKLLTEFSRIKNHFVLISTHNTNLAEMLHANQSIAFICFGSVVENDRIQFTYKAGKGISYDRIGMKLIEAENIFELMKNGYAIPGTGEARRVNTA